MSLVSKPAAAGASLAALAFVSLGMSPVLFHCDYTLKHYILIPVGRMMFVGKCAVAELRFLKMTSSPTIMKSRKIELPMIALILAGETVYSLDGAKVIPLSMHGTS